MVYHVIVCYAMLSSITYTYTFIIFSGTSTLLCGLSPPQRSRAAVLGFNLHAIQLEPLLERRLRSSVSGGMGDSAGLPAPRSRGCWWSTDHTWTGGGLSVCTLSTRTIRDSNKGLSREFPKVCATLILSNNNRNWNSIQSTLRPALCCIISHPLI